MRRLVHCQAYLRKETPTLICVSAGARSHPKSGGAFTAKEAALVRAEDAIAALSEQLTAVEAARAAEKQIAAQRIEDLSASLRREQMQCSVVEGALETARKDFACLMREAMALPREQARPDDPTRLRAANAA